MISSLRRCGDDPGAFLHVIEGDDRVVVVKHQQGRDRREIRNLRVRLQGSAEVIGDESGESALEGGKASDMRLLIFGKQTIDELQRRFGLRHVVEERSIRRDLQRRPGITGEERIAAEVFLAHHAFKKREIPFGPEARGKNRRFEIDDLPDLRSPWC